MAKITVFNSSNSVGEDVFFLKIDGRSLTAPVSVLGKSKRITLQKTTYSQYELIEFARRHCSFISSHFGTDCYEQLCERIWSL